MMKKFYLFVCPALLALSSCSNEANENGILDNTDAISFAAYPTKSRAVDADITSDNMKGDNFGVAGYSNNAIYLNKGTNGVKQKWDATNWEYANLADLKFWPENNMDFYAYFPYTDNATFADTNNDAGNSTVMTIPNVDCSHDVLFAFAGNQSKQTRVPLTFHHAFSKIKTLQIEMPAEGIVYKSGCQVEISSAEFIYTRTKGDVKVDKDGAASYSYDAESNPALKETLASAVTINSTNTSTNIIDYGTSSKGYFFATSATKVNEVTGTGALMWDGVKANIGGTRELSTSGLVCLKLTCKVWNGTEEKPYYYVGNASNFGEVYIPLKGLDADSNEVSEFDAGKRYIYKIVMKDNVGFTDAGDPILTPILFSVNSVDDWSDVTVTITL